MYGNIYCTDFTWTSVDWEKTGTRPSVSVGKRKHRSVVDDDGTDCKHKCILGDPGADKAGQGKSKRAEKYIWNEEK